MSPNLSIFPSKNISDKGFELRSATLFDHAAQGGNQFILNMLNVVFQYLWYKPYGRGLD